MADLLKEAKMKRLNAKAALTRAGKSLRYLIESKRTGQQEAWHAESQDAFMSLEFHAKLYLEGTEDFEKKFQVKESRSSHNENRLRNYVAVS